jgi:hypothetical protein
MAEGYDKFVATYSSTCSSLEGSQRHTLTLTDIQRDIPLGDPLRTSLGVYAIWDRDTFLYVGMVGTVPVGSPVLASEPNALGRARTAQGLFGRLHDHAYGNSHDRLWLLYAEREIIPSLTQQEQDQLKSGVLHLTTLVRQRIRELRFQYAAAPTINGTDARAVEAGVRRYGLPRDRLPRLNRTDLGFAG